LAYYLLDKSIKQCYIISMPKPNGDKCSVCSEKFDPQSYPFCSYCQSFLVEIEDLDLSPEADLVTIFRKNEEFKQ